MKRTIKYHVILSKDGLPFDSSDFLTLDQAIRWAEELRFEDGYQIEIYRGKEKAPLLQYVYNRNGRMDYTTNLFSRF